MRILHIIASPRAGSVSLKVGKAAVGSLLNTHPDAEVDTLDLFSETVPEFYAPAAKAKYAVMAGEEPSGEAERAWKEVIDAVDRLKAADVIVLSSAMWNFSIPYRLKQWIDVVCQPGLTFSYAPEAGYEGLLAGKTLLVCLARGGDYSPGSGHETYDHQESYLKMIFGFMGVTDVTAVVAQPTLLGGPEVAEERTNAAVAEAERLGREIRPPA